MHRVLIDLIDQTRYFYRTLLVTFLFSTTYLFIKDNKGEVTIRIKRLWKEKWKGMFLLYGAFMFTSTVLGRSKINPYQSVWNNIGFRINDMAWNLEIVKNILFFIPYIYLLLKAFKPKNPLFTAVLVSAGTSMFIEFSQLFSWLGSFQIADLIHNFIGGILGYCLWRIISKIKGLGINNEEQP